MTGPQFSRFLEDDSGSVIFKTGILLCVIALIVSITANGMDMSVEEMLSPFIRVLFG